jgi:hypothetical protein
MNLTPKTFRIGVGLFFIGLGFTILIKPRVEKAPPKPASAEAVAEMQARAYVDLEARENQAELSTGALAITAFRHEDVVLQWWRSFQEASDRWATGLALPLGSLRLATPSNARPIVAGIERSQQDGPLLEWSPTEWRRRVQSWQSDGWQVDRLSVRQTSFSPQTAQALAQSTFESSFVLTNTVDHRVGILRGPVTIDWSPASNEATPVPARTDVSRLEWLVRTG